MVALSITTEPAAEPVAVEIAEETRFKIDNDVAANWLLQKLATIDAEIARVTAQAATIVKQLEADRESLLYLYEGELSAFVAKKIEQSGGRRRSVHFLQGSCSFRRVPAHLTITDADAALQHAKETELPGCIKTVEKLDADAYRQLAEAYFEIQQTTLPGVTACPEMDRFSIRFPGRKEEDRTE